MESIAHELRKLLEARGECAIMANASTGWFAVFPKTWEERAEIARREGRDGPTLIVYRTNSGQPRDHYAIPCSVTSDLLVEETLTTSRKDGSRRWNLTLRNDRLHVTHRRGGVDISAYRGVPLLGEGQVTDTESLGDESSETGAGFGLSELNRQVEEAAVNLVSRTYRSEGWHVESVESERCGFDLCCLRGDGELHVEVKGVRGTDRSFVITAGELRRARDDDRFVLALVTSALSSSPVLERMSADRFLAAFSCEPIQFRAAPVGVIGRDP